MSVAAEDPRLDFLSSVDLASCRIEFSSAPIVLVCGGPVPPPKSHPEAADPAIASLRHAIVAAHPKFEIFRPEEIQDWHSDAVFKDLVSFERELAGICSLIVIILESAGSMTELGAFSQLNELADKSIIVCANKYVEDASFINFGILRFLSAKNESRVKSYPWDPKRSSNISEQMVADVVSDIQEEIEKLPKSSMLRSDQESHCMIVISELLRVFVALKEHELLEYLRLCGFPVTVEQLRGKLFLLKSFRIVKTQKYSDATFYMSGSEEFHRLRLAAIDKVKTIDALRISTLCLEFYAKDPKHKNWHRAITQVATGTSK